MHATLKYAVITIVAIDLAKDVFELELADAGARIFRRSRLCRNAFSKLIDTRATSCGSARDGARHFQPIWHVADQNARTTRHPGFAQRSRVAQGTTQLPHKSVAESVAQIGPLQPV